MMPGDPSMLAAAIFVFISGCAVLSFLWLTAKTVGFERDVSNLRVEAKRLIKMRERRLKAMRGEVEADGLTSVTIVDENAPAGDADKQAPGPEVAELADEPAEQTRQAA